MTSLLVTTVVDSVFFFYVCVFYTLIINPNVVHLCGAGKTLAEPAWFDGSPMVP